MKRTAIFFMIMTLISLSSTIQAQDENKNYKTNALDKLLVDIEATTGPKNKGMSPTTLNLSLGYQMTSCFYVFAKTEGSINLYNKDDIKTYYTSEALGGGLGIKLYNPLKTTDATDFRVSVINTIGNVDWKYTSYEANFIIYHNSIKRRLTKPFLGLGFRHMKSHTAGISNWNGIIATIGMRL